MTSEIIIDAQPSAISFALLEDKSLVEYQTETCSQSFSVGNVYLAKVKKVMPGLNACFVDVGYERDAFLHYLDLGMQYSSFEKYLKQVESDRRQLFPFDKAQRLPDLPKEESIQNVLKVGQKVLVQIVKEPISTKGPRLTGDISFAGRFMVLVPFGDKVSISAKIRKGEEKARLKQIIRKLLPKNFGVIIRTVAEGTDAAELEKELRMLLQRWDDMLRKVQASTKLPELVQEEQSRVVGMLRDLFNPSFENIYVNNDSVLEEVKSYVAMIAPDKENIVKRYTGKLPIFDAFDVTKQVKASFGKIVNYKHGAYLVIEHTEAMHVVDVNSGVRMRSDNGQEANALEVNLGAADELARQFRLRDMGGIIIIDFIDMKLAEDRQLLYERMCKNMQKDRARHNVLPLSKFGLMQITRQRVRPATDVAVDETCPTCLGKGKVRSSVLFVEQLERMLDKLVNQAKIKKLCLHVHPYVYAYICRGWLSSLKMQWKRRYGFGVKVVPSQKLGFLQYEFYDHQQQLIEVKDDKFVL